jgi:hypothetical protein
MFVVVFSIVLLLRTICYWCHFDIIIVILKSGKCQAIKKGNSGNNDSTGKNESTSNNHKTGNTKNSGNTEITVVISLSGWKCRSHSEVLC